MPSETLDAFLRDKEPLSSKALIAYIKQHILRTFSEEKISERDIMQSEQYADRDLDTIIEDDVLTNLQAAAYKRVCQTYPAPEDTRVLPQHPNNILPRVREQQIIFAYLHKNTIPDIEILAEAYLFLLDQLGREMYRMMSLQPPSRLLTGEDVVMVRINDIQKFGIRLPKELSGNLYFKEPFLAPVDDPEKNARLATMVFSNTLAVQYLVEKALYHVFADRYKTIGNTIEEIADEKSREMELYVEQTNVDVQRHFFKLLHADVEKRGQAYITMIIRDLGPLDLTSLLGVKSANDIILTFSVASYDAQTLAISLEITTDSARKPSQTQAFHESILVKSSSRALKFLFGVKDTSGEIFWDDEQDSLSLTLVKQLFSTIQVITLQRQLDTNKRKEVAETTGYQLNALLNTTSSGEFIQLYNSMCIQDQYLPPASLFIQFNEPLIVDKGEILLPKGDVSSN